jgi:hypothetical protein
MSLPGITSDSPALAPAEPTSLQRKAETAFAFAERQIAALINESVMWGNISFIAALDAILG